MSSIVVFYLHLVLGDLPCDADKDSPPLSRTQVSMPNDDSQKNDPAMDESNLCVGVAYDYGEYPKIVAVHSGIDQNSPLAKKMPRESKISRSPSEKGFKSRNEEERSNFGAHSTERLCHPINRGYPDCREVSGYQNEVMHHGFQRNGLALPDNFHDAARQPTVRYQNGRLVDVSVLPPDIQQFQHSRPQQNDCVRPTNIAENPQFRHIGYSTNRFQAPPGYGMYPIRPEMNVILHSYLSPLHANHALSQRPSVNIRNHLHTRLANSSSFQFVSTSSTYPARQNYVSNSRKRNYYQSNFGGMIGESIPSFESQKLSVPPNYMLPRNDMVRLGIPVANDITGINRFHLEMHPPPRYPHFYRPTCNEIVSAAVVSARRYATSNERLASDKVCENEPSFAKNDIAYPQKTCPLNVPEQWMNREFFQCLLLHENRFELLQLLKEAASLGREMLLYVIHRLLAKRLYRTSLIVLDLLKRSDLPDIVKEKVLSVFQEILWRRAPRFDLWSMENRQGNADKEIVASAKDMEELEEDRCENGISHDGLNTAKKVANSMPCFESITDHTNISDIDAGRASVHKDILQKSHANGCEQELDGIGKDPKVKEESEEDCCESSILHDNQDTAKEDVNSLPCIDHITRQADTTTIDSGRTLLHENQTDIIAIDHGKASLHEDVLRKSSPGCCDRNLDGTGKDPEEREESEEDHCISEILHNHLTTANEDAISFEGIADKTDIAGLDSGRVLLDEDLLKKSRTNYCDRDVSGISTDLEGRDESEDDRCDNRILHNHLDTKKEDDVTSFESITDQIDIAGFDNGQISVHEDVLQKSPTHCCDRDHDAIDKEPQDSHDTINTAMKKEEKNKSVDIDLDYFGRESHDNHNTFRAVIKKEINNNSVDVSSCCEIEEIRCENNLEGLQDCRKLSRESRDRELASVSSTQDQLDQDCFQTKDQSIQVEGIENFTVNISPPRDSEADTIETDQAAFDENSYAGFFSFDKLTNLENSNLEILGNISITMDSQGNTIINKEFSDEIDFEDEITIKGFKILREWTEPIGKDVSQLTVTDRPCYANIQS